MLALQEEVMCLRRQTYEDDWRFSQSRKRHTQRATSGGRQTRAGGTSSEVLALPKGRRMHLLDNRNLKGR